MLPVKEIGGWETYLAISLEASLTSPFSLLFNPQIGESYGLFLKQKQPGTLMSPGPRASLLIIQV